MPGPQQIFRRQLEVMESMQIQIDEIQSHMNEGMQIQINTMQENLTEFGERLSEVMDKLKMILPAQQEETVLKDTVRDQLKHDSPVDDSEESLCVTVNADRAECSLTESRDSYKCKDSCWELSLLIGMSEIGIGGSIMTSCTMILDIVFQVMLSLVIHINFVKDIPLYNVEVVREWRKLTGHHYSQAHPVHHTSLVTRVCHGDFIESDWWQYGLLGETKSFTRKIVGVSSGHWLCGSTILIWILIMWSDLHTGLKFLKAIFFLPRHGSSLRFQDGGFVLSSISFKRFALVIIIACIRVCVIGLITVSGVMWLAYTRNLRQFLTNMAALKFIPNLDQLMFQCFISHPVQHVLRSMKPLPTGKTKFYKGLGLEPLVLAIVCITVIALVSWKKILPNKQEAEDIQDALCGGTQTFVFGVNDDMGVLMTAKTNAAGQASFKHRQVAKYQLHVVGQLIQNPALLDRSNLAWQGTVPEVRQLAHKLVPDFFNRTLGLGRKDGYCYDYDQPSKMNDKPFERYWLAMRFQAGLQSASSCIDISMHCLDKESYIFRFICPVTCGCASPISSLHWGLGCPPRHECAHHFEIHRPCVDMDASELGQNWSRKWNSWVTVPPGSTRPSRNSLVRGAHGYIPLICTNFSSARHSMHMFCADRTSTHGEFERSISAFCPISCQCHNKTSVSDMMCPTTCKKI